MTSLAKVREQYPQYKDVDDTTLADALHRKFYSDVPRAEFDAKLGIAPAQEPTRNALDDIASPLNAAPGGETIRANAAGDTRAKMPLKDIASAYDVAQQRGDRPEQQAMARAYVQRERADSPIMMGVSDRVRSVARGVPFIGEYLDEANAKTGALFGGNYQKALDYENARDSTFDAANPKQALAGKVAGGIAGTIAAAPAVAGNAGGLLFGLGAKSIPGAIARGSVAGAAQGAAAGYGREGTAEATAKDALFGAGFGAAIPAALGAVKSVGNRIIDNVAPGDALSNVPSKARDFFLKQFGPGTTDAMKAKMAEIGPNAVLADVSPEMQMIARGAASRPGSREAIVEALAARDAGKNARLGAALDENLGKAVAPSAVQAELQAGKKAVGPLYDEALGNARAVDTKAVAQGIDTQIVDARGPVRAALENARNMLNVYGTKELDPSPRAIFETRKALDGMIGEADRGGNGAVVRALSAVRAQIDEALGTAAPGIKNADANYASLARQGDALEEGAKVFTNGPQATRPVDLQARLQPEPAGMGPSAEPFRMKQGARADLDRVVGTAANDVAKVRQLMAGEGDWNRDKLRLLFGKDRADAALKALDAETAMENTYKTVVGGSQTAQTQGFKEFLDEAGKGINVPADATITGGALRGAKKIVERLTGSNNEAKAQQFAQELGRLSVVGGSDADQLIAAIMKRQGRATGDQNFADFAGRAGAGAARADDPAGVKAVIAALIAGKNYARDRAGAPQR